MGTCPLNQNKRTNLIANEQGIYKDGMNLTQAHQPVTIATLVGKPERVTAIDLRVAVDEIAAGVKAGTYTTAQLLNAAVSVEGGTVSPAGTVVLTTASTEFTITPESGSSVIEDEILVNGITATGSYITAAGAAVSFATATGVLTLTSVTGEILIDVACEVDE